LAAVSLSLQIEDLNQSAQVAAAEKLKSSAKESSKTTQQAAAASALEPESESDEEVCFTDSFVIFTFSALTLLVGQQEGHPACKKTLGGAVSPVGVAPTRTVSTSASIILPCSIKIQKTGGG